MADHPAMTTPQLPPPPTVIRRAVLAFALLLGASSLGGLALAGFGTSSVVIGMLGFEIVVLAATVLAVLAGLGRFASGYAMALACVAGTVFAASVLGFVDGRPNFVSSPDMSRLLRVLVMLRISLAGVLAALGALAVFSRRRSSWRFLSRAIFAAAPIVVVVAIVYFFARNWVTVPREGSLETVRIGSLVLGILVLGGFFCAAVHLTIRAFQAGDLDRMTENDGA